jgi:biopolymer transport protein ExbD
MGAKVSTGGSTKRGSYDTNADMNIIPFIDILLVLLIIFMVAAPIPTTDVKVDLPPPVPPPQNVEKPAKPTIVNILDDKMGGYQIFVDTEAADIDKLDEVVLAHISMNVPNSPNRLLESIRVRADQTLPYGTVMGTMALLQAKNFQKISLVAEDAIPEDQLGQ